jgi:hypothetical protein
MDEEAERQIHLENEQHLASKFEFRHCNIHLKCPSRA